VSIEEDYRDFQLVCDNCGKVHDELFEEFRDAVEAKKEIGWKSKKINGEWEDWCDECCYEGDKEKCKDV